MNHLHPGSFANYNTLANYNSLTDKHLAGYFSNTRIRRHLLRSGLISRSGRIISEKEYRLNAMRKDHQKYIRECLAQAIFHKVLDMERHHQVEIKRKLENSARRERVQRIKVDRSRKAAEDTNHLLSPHPPTVPRNRFGRRKLGERGETGNLATCPRPSTAPGNIQHPVRLQPLYGSATTESTPKATSTCRAKFLTLEKERQLPSGGDKGVLKPMHSTDYSSGISPYRLPIINNYVIPIPPPPPPKSEKTMSTMKGGTPRGRRFRPTTAPNGLEQLLMRDTGKFYRPQVHSNAYVTMIYLGKPVHLSYDLLDYREEIKIYQQHCGGENLCVYKGKLLEGETFHFISRRHYGFPFSLTFYLNGIQVDRLSSCCEYKHRKGTRLGGKHGHFGFVNVERSAPCYRCIIAMGLDKKPSPPKKTLTDEDEAKKEDSEKEEVKCNLKESSSSEEDKKDSVSQFSPAPEERKVFAEDAEVMEWETRREERASDESENYQRSSAYDEDFEADEEKSDEKVNEEGQADDQMNGMSKSPSDDEKDNLDHERENKNSSQKALRASDSERDESDGYGESDSEGEDKQDKKLVSSPSSSSILYSNENVSDSETRKQDEEQDNTDIHSEYESEITKSQREESQETDVEEEMTGEGENATPKHVPGLLGEHKMESNLRHMTPTCEKLKIEGLVDMNRKEGTEEDLLVDFRSSCSEEKPSSTGPSEDEEEGECKSVKEKIAEAIEHDQLLSSEPEPSDSSTEDEEESEAAVRDKHEDGTSLAKKSKALKSQKVAERVEQERQMVGKERALEEEELVDEEGPKEGTLEEFLAKNAMACTAKQAVKDQVVSRETELEEEIVVEADLDDEEKEVTYEEGKPSEEKVPAERKGKKAKVMAAEHETCDAEVISGESQLEGEVKDSSLTKKLITIGKGSEGEEGTEEVIEAFEVPETIELVEKIAMEGEGHKAKEIVKEVIQTGEALGTESEEESQRNMKEAESEGNATLQELDHKAESVETASLPEDESMRASGFMGDEYVEEEKYIKIKLREPDSKEKETIAMHEQGEERDMEEIVEAASSMWEKDLEKKYPERRTMKNIFTEEDSAQMKLKPWMKELDHHETEKVISPTEEGMVGTEKTALNGESLVQAVREEAEQEETEEILISKTPAPRTKLDFEKEEPFTEDISEAVGLVTGEPVRKREAEEGVDAKEVKARRKVVVKEETETEGTKRKGAVKGKVEAERAEGEAAAEKEVEDEEAKRLLAVRWEMRGEDSETEGEVVSLVTESEGEPVSEMTFMRWQSVGNMREDLRAEAKHVPESPSQKAAVIGLDKEMEMGSEGCLEDEAEETPKETIARQKSVYLEVQSEEVTDEEENEGGESSAEEQVAGEGVITLADVEEALLIGIQQLITEVSRMNEEVEDKEEPQEEGLAEEMSTQEDPEKEDFVSVSVAKEKWHAEGDEAEEGGTGEPWKGSPLEGNSGSEKRTRGDEESPAENLAVTKVIHWSVQQSEGEQHHKPTGSSEKTEV